MATDHDRWPSLIGRAMFPDGGPVGTLPPPTLPPLNGSPRPDRDAEMKRHPLVKVRSLVSDRYHNGRRVSVGDVIALPAPEARAWVRLGWAEAT
jgi:hypothetical protein